MFGGIRVGTLAGIPFFVNPSWVLAFAWVTYSLASLQLPLWAEGATAGVYWLLAPVLALMLFGSLVAHELGHSLVSRLYGIPVRSITLHLFGGVAQLGREVRRAREEFWIAVAGPAVSVALAVAFWYGGDLLGAGFPAVGSGLQLLGLLNAGIVAFNMVPGFPLDGGRVLRSLIWGLGRDYKRATRVAANVGRSIGWLMILLGVYLVVSEGMLSSLWLVLVGWFLSVIARRSYEQAVVHDALTRLPVSRAQVALLRVPDELTLDELYAGYIRTTGFHYYLVENGGRPVGIVDPSILERTPAPLWRATPLRSAMRPLGSVPEIEIGASADAALAIMEDRNTDLLLTSDRGTLVGVLPRRRLLEMVRIPVPA